MYKIPNTRFVLLLCLLHFPTLPPSRADDWPQWRGPRRDGVWRETGIVEKLPAELKLKWRSPIGGGYAGPAVAGGRVYVTDRQLRQGSENPENPFDRQPVEGVERVLCLDAASGEVLWTHEYPCRYEISYPSGPRATPAVDGGNVYTLGAMGDLFCLDAAKGHVRWHKSFVRDLGTEINTWGTTAAPLVDAKKLIVLAGGKDKACVVAFDKDSGKELWRALEAQDFGYCPPVIFEIGGVRLLIVWTPENLHALDPETGREHWRQGFRLNSGLSIATPVYEPQKRLLLVSAFYNGSMMMRLDAERPAANVLWKGKSSSEHQTDGLHALMCTPVIDGGHIFGVCSYGQLRCLELETGKRVWETLQATGSGRWWNAFIVPQGGRFFLANEQGELIIAKLSPQGYEEQSRAFLIEPTNRAQRRKVVWSHPAFAQRCVFARNDKEILCADLSVRGE
jgi:outer membrane protein assembly factor BamB